MSSNLSAMTLKPTVPPSCPQRGREERWSKKINFGPNSQPSWNPSLPPSPHSHVAKGSLSSLPFYPDGSVLTSLQVLKGSKRPQTGSTVEGGRRRKIQISENIYTLCHQPVGADGPSPQYF